jgi:LmbE family N-acetylglucosaminyl deacetylase
MRVLHVSPHPDDELVGAPATLMALRDAGHEVTNLALSLGRPADHERRRTEVEEACRRAGFALSVTEPPIAMSATDDRHAAEERVRWQVGMVLDGAEPPDLIVGPSPHDVHHAHELTGRAVREVLAARDEAPPWWMWAIWGDLPFPTTVTTFDDGRAREIDHALSAHEGEMARADHRVHVEARGRLTAVTAAEKVFGFGAPALAADRAEVVTEVVRRDGEWVLGSPRALDAAQPLGRPTSRVITQWLESQSARELGGGPYD